MVGKHRSLLLRRVLWVLISLVLLASAAAADSFVLADPASPVYYRFAFGAGESIQVDRGSLVLGSIHGNDTIGLGFFSLIHGDVSAVGEIEAGGFVTGTVSEGVAPVPLPALPPAEELRALADQVLPGGTVLQSAVVDDIVFVEGDLEIRRNIGGRGTIIATGEIHLRGRGFIRPFNSRLSLISYGDIRFGRNRWFRGILRAAGNIELDQRTVVLGVAVANGELTVGRRSFFRFINFDREAPQIDIVSPLDGSVLGQSMVEVVASFSDDLSGVDPSTVVLLIDGIDRTADATVTSEGLTFVADEGLVDGPHVAALSARDVSGREGAASVTFVVESGPGDNEPPELTIVAPGPTVFNDRNPQISLTYADETALDLTSLRVVLDGGALTGCQVEPTAATCETPMLDAGAHVLELEIRDAAGNLSTARLDFTIDLRIVPQTVTVQAVADTTLQEASPDTNQGARPRLSVGEGGRERLLVRVDANAARELIGTGTLVLAQLELTVDTLDAGASSVAVELAAHRLTDAWQELTATWQCADDTVPGNGMADCPGPWNGGAFAATPSSVATATGGQVEPVRFDVTADVQTVLDGGTHEGWLVKKVDESSADALTFGARERDERDEHPRLTLIFEAPGDAGGNDVTAPSLAILRPVEDVIFNDQEAVVGVEFSDFESGIDISSPRVVVAGVDLTESCFIGFSSVSCELPALTAGTVRIEAEVSDLAGNRATAVRDYVLSLDVNGPVIAIESPAEGSFVSALAVTVSGSVSDAGGVDEVSVAGITAPIDGDGRFAVTVDLTEGGMEPIDGETTLIVVATDVAGNQSQREISVNADASPPSLLLSAPAPDTEVNGDAVLVRGTVSDLNGVAEVLVAGSVVTVDGNGMFATDVTLVDGPNAIGVSARDVAGNITATEVRVQRFALPTVEIQSPAAGTLTTDFAIEVQGVVSAGVTDVVVNGVAATVGGGTFAAQVNLDEGANRLTAVAIDNASRAATDTVTVGRDRTAPRLAIVEPAAGTVVRSATIRVLGFVLDPAVSGTVAEPVTVTVDGQTAIVDNQGFVVESLPLVAGVNTVRAVATDAAGNITQTEIDLRFEPTASARLEVASGDRQQAVVGSPLLDDLEVRAVDATGLPVAGVTVAWSIVGTDATFTGGDRRIVSTTDAQGLARAGVVVGSRAGAGSQQVHAVASGFSGPAIFLADALPGPMADLLVDSGDQQVGATGGRLPEPFAVVATDAQFNRLEGVPVTFRVVAGGGQLTDGSTEMTVLSDAAGQATASLILGAEPGIANNLVWATLDGLAESPIAGFSASARTAGDPAATAVRGQVLDNSDLPVPGVTIDLEETGRQTVTDDQGLFRIDGAPIGSFTLRVDGSSANRPGPWPTLEFELTTIAGVENSLGRPIYLVPLDTAGGVFVSETEGGVVTLEDVPGFALTIAPGSATFPDGSREGTVSVTPVHYDKVPMAPNFGQQPRLVVTIQPSDTVFDPPARLTLPNLEGLAPGRVTEMYSFDHDLMRFVSIGPGTVTEDGSSIVSNVGAGVVKAGWHCGGDPAGSGTTHDCGFCRECIENSCENASEPVPPDNDPQNCRTNACILGTPISVPAPFETPMQRPGNCQREICKADGSRGVVRDLLDAPTGQLCCENPIAIRPWPYDPTTHCCEQKGILSLRPIDKLDDCPRRRQRADFPDPFPHQYDGCTSPFGDNPTGGANTSFANPERTGPCDLHDACYQTCNSNRDACDLAFYLGMLGVCNSGSANDNEFFICERHAAQYYVAVSLFGGSFWKRRQKDFCQCC